MSAPLSIRSLSHQHPLRSNYREIVSLHAAVSVDNNANLHFKNLSHYKHVLEPLGDVVNPPAIKSSEWYVPVENLVLSGSLQVSFQSVIRRNRLATLIKTDHPLRAPKVTSTAPSTAYHSRSYLQAMSDFQPDVVDLAIVADAKKKLTPLATHHGGEQVVCHHDVMGDGETDIISSNHQSLSLINRARILIRKKGAAIVKRLYLTLGAILNRTVIWLKHHCQLEKLALWMLSFLALLIANELFLLYWQQIITSEIFIWPLENNEINSPRSTLFDTKKIIVFK
ncbi:hypothetical protein [Candidatus Regiella endosymbiont of Tuberolachnus salignus]|uniref:hypothetical protein n=1 Tax=Candidatus Regiella endosymbiont of Tuberolachnus salignus TaxID=3077956 RepID=UPI0030D018D9